MGREGGQQRSSLAACRQLQERRQSGLCHNAFTSSSPRLSRQRWRQRCRAVLSCRPAVCHPSLSVICDGLSQLAASSFIVSHSERVALTLPQPLLSLRLPRVCLLPVTHSHLRLSKRQESRSRLCQSLCMLSGVDKGGQHTNLMDAPEQN
jgi:hypothetical protein